MKNIYFLSGLPRAGNTLFGYLLNQNNDITVTANSILPSILYSLYKLKFEENYLNFPDKKSFDNIYINVLNNYFKDWKSNNIISRGPWGTEANLFLLKNIIKKPKFIILYRPIHECINSFISINKIKKENINSYSTELMSLNGPIGKSLLSIKNILKKKEDYLVIHYKELIKNPEKEIKKVFKYLDIKYEKLNFNVKKQFQANDIKYDDSIFEQPIHEIRLGKVKMSKTKNYLSKFLIQKCKNEDLF
jgi:hypothetical protein|tara:strand:+ start:1423 stop:2163 length:741 start_codon:yes stop_codon:yes gene_type:complete